MCSSDLSIVKTNTDTNMDADTRIVVLFPSAEFCTAINNFLEDFVFSIDVKTSFVSAPNAIEPLSVLLYDDIGIFKSNYWTKNPKLNFTLTQAGNTTTEEKLDLTPFLPQQNTFLGQELNISEATVQLG